MCAEPVARPRRRNRRGFTMVELLIVMLVMGLLAALAIYKFWDFRDNVRVAAVTGDFRSVMVASYSYFADHDTWPPDGNPGVIPPALVNYLPSSADFSKPEYTLEYDNIPVGQGHYIIGVTVSSPRQRLMDQLIRTLGNQHPFFVAGGTLTYVIIASDGSY